MTKPTSNPADPTCPHCGCPALLTYGRQRPDGFAIVTSCCGCGKVIIDEPEPEPVADKGNPKPR